MSEDRCSVIEDYAEYSGEAYDEIIPKIHKFQSLTGPEFIGLQEGTSKWEAQTHFYSESKNYIYDLLGGNLNLQHIEDKLEKFTPGILNAIATHPGSSFMEFGGGIGVMCQLIAEKTTKQVVYVDIDSPITEFARWRFQKYNHPQIEMIEIAQDDFDFGGRQFSIIFSDAVWEHLDPPRQLSYASKLAQALEANGILVFYVDVAGEDALMPMHYNVDMNLIFDRFKGAGLIPLGIHSHRQFASVWRKHPVNTMAATRIPSPTRLL